MLTDVYVNVVMKKSMMLHWTKEFVWISMNAAPVETTAIPMPSVRILRAASFAHVSLTSPEMGSTVRVSWRQKFAYLLTLYQYSICKHTGVKMQDLLPITENHKECKFQKAIQGPNWLRSKIVFSTGNNLDNFYSI